MKKTLLAVTLAALTSGAATSALAADPKAPAPDFEFSGNVAVVSDYRFRGVSETNRKAAFQGGFDLAHKSGFYIGNWNSNINYGGSDPAYLESDFYGGYATELSDVGLDVGVLRYQYPGAGNYNTTEAYLGLSYGPASYKYSRTMSENRFGVGLVSGTVSQKGAAYHDLGLEFSLSEQISVGAHAGFTKFEGVEAATRDYKDYSVSISYALPDDYSVGLTYHSVSLKAGQTKSDTQKNKAVISLSKSF